MRLTQTELTGLYSVALVTQAELAGLAWLGLGQAHRQNTRKQYSCTNQVHNNVCRTNRYRVRLHVSGRQVALMAMVCFLPRKSVVQVRSQFVHDKYKYCV
jgi:hypothetical protein